MAAMPAAFNTAAAATALAGALALPPPPVLFTAPSFHQQLQQQQPRQPPAAVTSRDVNKDALDEGEFFLASVSGFCVAAFDNKIN